MDPSSLERLVAEVALQELGEDRNRKEEALREMRTWITQHPSIIHCRTDDIFLLRFLRVKKYDVTKAQQMLLNFLNLKNVLPQSIMGDHDVTAPSVQEFMCDGFYFSSPHRDAKGRRVFLMVPSRIDVARKKYTFDQPARTILLTNLITLEEEASQVLGYTYILDAANMSLGHIGIFPSPFETIRVVRCGEDAIPMRIKEIHILNLPFYLTWFFNLIKTALGKKLGSRVMVHRSLKTLQQVVDSKVLPKEYGGEASTDEMIESWSEELVLRRESIREFNNIRLKSDKESEKSFRNLQVD